MSIEKEISSLALALRELAGEISKLSFDQPVAPKVEAVAVEPKAEPIVLKTPLAPVVEEKKEEAKPTPPAKFVLAPQIEKKVEEKCPFNSAQEVSDYIIQKYQERCVEDPEYDKKLQAAFIQVGIEDGDINNLQEAHWTPLYHAIEAIR